MGKVFGYILAAAITVLASCTKEQVGGENLGTLSEGPRIITLSLNPSTKTTPGTDGRSPEFADGDLVRLSNSIAWEECAVSVSGNVATVTTFLTGELKVVYPAGAAATDANGLITGINVPASQSGHFRDANICMATIPAAGNSATLENQTAVLRFYVDASIGVKSVTVRSSTENIANKGGYLKQITVDPAGNELISSVTDDPGHRLCYIAVLPGVNTSKLTFTGVTTTQGTVTHKPLKTSVALAASGIYNAFIPYYIKIKVSDSPETYQKWGYCNVGAFLPEDYGRYFAWGDTVGQAWTGTAWSGGGFFQNNCPFYDSSTSKYTKYIPAGSISGTGTVDNRTELEAADDAASVNWGENWRIPSGGTSATAEFTVLTKACREGYTSGGFTPSSTDTEPATRGVYYYNVTGKEGVYFVDAEGHKLFFPAAGYGENAVYKISGETTGIIYCWTSTLNPDNYPKGGHDFKFRTNEVNPQDGSSRFTGFPVRPIYNPPKGADFNPYDDKGNI